MKLTWDEVGNKLYETGTSKGVLYPQDASGAYPVGVAWDGLIGVTESPSGAEPTALYANNRKYLELRSAEELGVTITAYTYPDEFGECDGSVSPLPGVSVGMQPRKGFGLVYQTIQGNDTSENDYGYKLHLVYGCKASPSERAYSSVNDSPEAIEFSWEATTTPVPVDYGDLKTTSILTITSTDVNAAALKKLEDILYGTDEQNARLPLPDEVIKILLDNTVAAEVKVYDKNEQVYSVNVSDLQENIVIGKDSITGKLKYKKDFTGFGGSKEEQSGNYLALSLEAKNGETIKTKVIGGDHGEITVTDGFCVYRIKNKTQKIQVTAEKDSTTTTTVYSLTGLTLEPNDQD